MIHIEKAIILRDFSRCESSSECELSENELKFVPSVSLDNENVLFYANGNCEENKGYLSIICKEIILVELVPRDSSDEIEIRYFFSVVDVSGNKRFTQTIVYNPGKAAQPNITKGSHFGLERFLNRETLLNDPAELLPGDCLTISVEIDCLSLYSVQDIFHVLHRSDYTDGFQQVGLANDDVKQNCMIHFSFSIDENGMLCIPLDSFYGRKLCSLSQFFQRASDTTLTEDTIRIVHILEEEVYAFNNILNILFKPFRELYVKSIEYICQLYVIADKYDFQSVIEVCREFIKAFLRTTDDLEVQKHAIQSVPDIQKLVNKYGDSELKDTLKTYLESKDRFGTNDYDLGQYLNEVFFTEWKCISRKVGRNQLGNIYQYRLSRIMEPEFEFYL